MSFYEGIQASPIYPEPMNVEIPDDMQAKKGKHHNNARCLCVSKDGSDGGCLLCQARDYRL